MIFSQVFLHGFPFLLGFRGRLHGPAGPAAADAVREGPAQGPAGGAAVGPSDVATATLAARAAMANGAPRSLREVEAKHR